MSADDSTSVRHSATISPPAQPGPNRVSDDPGQPGKEHGEADYFAREAETAKAAVVATLDRLKADLRSAADIEYWTRRYPWAAVGIAAVAGFVAAAALIPESAGAARMAAAPPQEAEGPRAGSNGRPRASTPSWLSSIAAPLAGLARASAEQFLQAAMRSGQEAAAGEEKG